jgi:O-glycosyl hydrolase
VESVPFTHLLTVRPGERKQVIDGFGASDCWSFQKIDSWPESTRERIADLLFSPTKGIGLSMWRFNIGAGVNAQITHPWRSSECFEVAPGKYDWSRQASQRSFLEAAKERGVSTFVAFALSPPGRMTRNGLTFCTDGLGSTNLKKGHEAAYARFLVDVLKRFPEFTWISPVNEPQWEWNSKVQEGNRASNEDLVRIYRALASELKRQGVHCSILGPESGNPAGLIEPHGPMARKYGTPYGGYLDLFCRDRKLGAAMSKVVAGHSYWANGYGSLVRERRRLRAKLDRYPDWRYWQTEYCILRGPGGESGWGRDLTMKTALWVARIVHYDLTVANASAWCWWTALSPEDFKDGLLYTNYREPGDEREVIPSRTLWALGNYSRFVRPGMHRVALSGANHGVNGLLASAFAGDKSLVIVLVNMRGVPERVSLSVPGLKAPLRPYVTSKDADLGAGEPFRPDQVYTVPARSVVTLVADR